LYKGDIVYPCVGSIGNAVVIEENDKYHIQQNIAKITCNESTSPYYIVQFLTSYYGEKQVYRFNASGAQPNVLVGSLRNYKINLPSLPEQQKIASFLSAVDEKLQQLNKKKELLETYKKGVMQKIFSQELRFKDEFGNSYPDWEEKRLGAIAFKTSSNISANKIEENFGEYVLYGASGILKKIDFYREENPYISIVKDGAGVGRVLMCEPYSSVLGTLDMIKPKGSNDLYFIFTLLQRIYFERYTVGSTIPHIYFKDYSLEKIKVPSLEEQQKIANFLSSLDSKIDLVSTQTENTKAFKKGLLQQMFV
jgi:type I restriction enzyme S subunit